MASKTRNPTGDEAVGGTWSGSAGSRFASVDDHPDSGGADFLTHGTTSAGNLTFTFTAFDVPAGATINSVKVHYYDRKNANQSCNIAARLKVGGSYFAASSHNPTNGSIVLRTDTFTTNPATGLAWTPSEVNAIQAFGWVSTDANPAIDLFSIQLEVDYTFAPTLTIGQGSFTLSGQSADLRFTAVPGTGGIYGLGGLFWPSPPTNTFTLVAQGTFLTLTGQDVTLTFSQPAKRLTAETGMFELLGVENALTHRVITASTGGIYGLGGLFWPAGIKLLSAETGVFNLSGQAAITARDYIMSFGAGAFTVTGQPVTFRYGRVMAAGPGSFGVSGQTVTLQLARKLTAARGTFTLSGQAVTLRSDRILRANQGSFTLTGQSVSLRSARKIIANHGAYTLSGQAVSLLSARRLVATQGTYVLNGQPVNLTFKPVGIFILSANMGTFTLAGQAVTLKSARKLVAGPATYTITGQAAVLKALRYLLASHGAYTVTGQAVTMRRLYELLAETGLFTLVGHDAGLIGVVFGGMEGPLEVIVKVISELLEYSVDTSETQLITHTVSDIMDLSVKVEPR